MFFGKFIRNLNCWGAQPPKTSKTVVGLNFDAFPIHSLYLGPLSPLKFASLKATRQIFPLQQKALNSLGAVFVVSTRLPEFDHT